MADRKEQKSASRFEEEIKLFDRELKQVTKHDQLYPLFAFLGGAEPANITEEIALLERYVNLIKSYYSDLLMKDYMLEKEHGYDTFFGNLLKMVEVLRQAKDEPSQRELMINMYDTLKGKLQGFVESSTRLKDEAERGGHFSPDVFKFDADTNVTLSTLPVAIKSMKLAQDRLGQRLDEVKAKEFSP